jgi:indolepyruvate ferredoxin oxidoreductase beta subunit
VIAEITGYKAVIAGIGGQGVIFATRLLTRAAIRMGLPAIASESHGMSQRGGSVVSHVKFGGIQSPLIRRGTADLILGLDQQEALRNLAYLRGGGSAVMNSDNGIGPELEQLLAERQIQIRRLPASQMAIELGSVTVANVVLIGYASTDPAFPLPQDVLRETLREAAPRAEQLNQRALEAGRAAAKLELAGASSP